MNTVKMTSEEMGPEALRRELGYLYRMVEAGERGYAVVAANVDNRGLKLLFKTYAQQRAEFKEQIFAELWRLGFDQRPRSSLRAMIHRGRIDIFAAMTIGDENVERVVLKEVAVGERAAIRAYEKVLKKNLPPETRELVERQYREVRPVVDEINRMRGLNGKRLVLRLFDTERDAGLAVETLRQAGFSEESIERLPVEKAIKLYEGKGSSIFETILSGVAGGALWGAVNGIVAGFTVINLPGAGSQALTPGQIWALAALACIAGGTFVGTMIGTFIGWGVTGGDRYLSDQGLLHGKILVRALADERRASAAWRILAQVNIESRGLSTDMKRNFTG